MTLLSHDELLRIVEQEIITPVDVKDINAASIDIHLGDTILWEDEDTHRTIDFRKRDPVTYNEHQMDADGWVLQPGDFILAQSREVFNLPNWLSAEYKLKSSMARIGLEHMNAGWCDAGWHGSVLTLELKNMCQYHSIRIRPGDAIGQMVFFRHQQVSSEASYSSKGRYNNHNQVMGIVK
jgi:dCTP deaminase